MALMKGEALDVVVADFHMPGIDGVAVTRHARGHCPPIPVVLMTAYPAREAQPQPPEAGGVVHVAKPFRNADLLKAIRRAQGASGEILSASR